jgi:type VI secretion system FHA domain protein
MSLTLEVAGPQARALGAACRKVFNSKGGSIGRLAGNDWVLPDDYVSGQHAVIHFSNGTYFLEDRSSNGVFINSPQTRLPKNQPCALKDGDRFFIDTYEILVTITSDVPASAPMPGPVSASPGVAASRQGRSPLDDLFAPSGGGPIPDEPFAPEDPYRASPPAAAVRTTNNPQAPWIPSTDPLPFAEVDPLKALGLQPEPEKPRVPRAQDLANDSLLVEPYKPPNIVTQPIPSSDSQSSRNLIPEDYDPLLSSEPVPAVAPSKAAAAPRPAGRAAPDAPVQQPPAVARPQAPVQPAPPRMSPQPPPAQAQPRGAMPATLLIPAPARTPAPMQTPAPAQMQQARRPVAVQTLSAPQPPLAPPPRPAAPPPAEPAATGSHARVPAASPDFDFAALLAAAGLDSSAYTPELAAVFGGILRVVVAGLMDLLRARESIKDEFRMHMTTFKAVDNNPLKFSANVEDALHNLLVKRNAAYMPPVEAFQDAFQDARNHQLAMLAGLRAAFDSMLGEFDPEQLQEQFDRQAKKSSLLGAAARWRYWELYQERYQDAVKDADAAFRNLFGQPFAKAYEEQMQRLKALGRASQGRS